jgi:hypothetical protein
LSRHKTIYYDAPAAISYFTPAGGGFTSYWHFVTNGDSSSSICEARIRSAFEGAGKELEKYERYPARWDGYRAPRFSLELLDRAEEIIGRSYDLFLEAGLVPSLVTTGPASDGSIDVELAVADKRVLMTLYPNEDQVHLSSFERDEAHEHLVSYREHTVEEWFTWLAQPSAVQASVAADPVHPGR